MLKVIRAGNNVIIINVTYVIKRKKLYLFTLSVIALSS